MTCVSNMMAGRFIVYLMLWIASVTTDLTCRDLRSVCTCGMKFVWYEGAWKNLAVVNCSSAGLVSIPNFSSLEGQDIDMLILNNNNLTDIPPNAFRNLTVKELVLSRNPLKSIRQNLFAPLKESLKKLELQGVELYIDDGLVFLSNLDQLRALDLGNNHLKNEYGEFTGGIFDGLGLNSLKTLGLRVLKMTKLKEGAFRGLPNLEELDISINYLAEIPGELKNVKNLRVLNMYSNEINILKNGTFDGLSNVESLYFGANEIATIEEGAFAGLEDSLQRINLYHNALTSVPVDAIVNLRKLKMLGFAANNIQTIENGTLVGEYRLEILELDKNPLTYHENMFTGVEDSLTTLFIRENELTTLPLRALRKLKRLSHLDAADNHITEIDKLFFGNLKLSKIYLMRNKISKVDPSAFESHPNGIILDLYKNLLTDISFILKLEVCKFDDVDVSSNPVICDCSIEEILNSGRVAFPINGECSFPEDESKIYRFDSPRLMERLVSSCNRTKQYAFCRPSVYEASSTSRVTVMNVLVTIMTLITYLQPHV
ncbi:hypothetical protein ACJMK2_030926 [Sinanodonta woodiana]|uniref:Uncharacterized protein n=1 Tax=Sinanodonta woodiana TaxID=1069815 RepID=A0ABD3X174_SINWO